MSTNAPQEATGSERDPADYLIDRYMPKATDREREKARLNLHGMAEAIALFKHQRITRMHESAEDPLAPIPPKKPHTGFDLGLYSKMRSKILRELRDRDIDKLLAEKPIKYGALIKEAEESRDMDVLYPGWKDEPGLP